MSDRFSQRSAEELERVKMAVAETLPRRTSVRTGDPEDPLLTARQSADDLNISMAALWKGVADGRLPAPFYVLPRAPRWRRSELRAALEANRMLPSEAKLARRTRDHRTT